MLLSQLSSILFALAAATVGAHAQQTVRIPSTSADIDYSPALCNASVSESCSGVWQVLSDVPNTSVVATYGPANATGDIIPQAFFSFRASSVQVRTSPYSNATINFTLSAPSTGVFVTKEIQSDVQLIVGADIPDTQVTTLGITFIPQEATTRFDIEYIELNVTNSSATSSFLPSFTLPASSSPPTYFPPTSTSQSHHSASSGTIAGAVVGSVLGVCAIGVVAGLFYRKRNRGQLRRLSMKMKRPDTIRRGR
ncbi:hypothetical protein CONPUDRAFT_112458 [Coniophora puteana RWD-64-598 SS2]|uniref:Uncharacterized protein n=1 Tax=Coniophora puteana (strain RWD-64-598) TaxID=741705 RepID=A0A5M3M795_CONPW|nr:uncharacterized protein CONPUDRAFT_112458 [Coniophora puteana RWD-64-598 SS2]EIW75182.1 hypothetical protein CONPUDRAFT_112458 [Coniophora puteana RWD-64-598 SS2]